MPHDPADPTDPEAAIVRGLGPIRHNWVRLPNGLSEPLAITQFNR